MEHTPESCEFERVLNWGSFKLIVRNYIFHTIRMYNFFYFRQYTRECESKWEKSIATYKNANLSVLFVESLLRQFFVGSTINKLNVYSFMYEPMSYVIMT